MRARPHPRPLKPLMNRARKKPRRMPLVLRFIKGSIHSDILLPVVIHALFAALIVYVDDFTPYTPHLPGAITSSLSIVVGLLLVFRNQSSYARFWSGQNDLTTICTNIRNLTRSFLTCNYNSKGPEPTPAERAETESAIYTLLAIAYAVKNTLQWEWEHSIGAPDLEDSGSGSLKPELRELLGPKMSQTYEFEGLGLPIQLTMSIEAYIKRSHDRGWFHSPQASQLSVQLNTLVSAYGSMETIRLTPIPVAYLIHTRQVLALYGGVLPFGFVESMQWWTVVIVSLITFTLYGIEAIAYQLEEPFGWDKADIKMDDVIEDLRIEVSVLLREWQANAPMFGRQ
jgi:putative membrane protein